MFKIACFIHVNVDLSLRDIFANVFQKRVQNCNLRFQFLMAPLRRGKYVYVRCHQTNIGSQRPIFSLNTALPWL